ncbi:cytochrome P450 [Pholiota conissans]|uniref:Cytochrome P450 n=1 Tax=Pholiota conissans TaxID=109636 RepID=A0A9P5YTQ6_9AGAR|nr:cytochrome P450 [Pholiota conissans]
MNSTYTAVSLVLAIGLWFIHAQRAKRRLLPGPPRLPFIGSALYMPTRRPWLVFSEWDKTYGGIFQLDVLGKSIVVINSLKIAKDLLDKRSSIYSDRPHAIMAGDLNESIGFSKSLGFLPYGDTWRKQRRIVIQNFTPSMVPKYHALQEKEAATLVKNVLEDPDTLRKELHFRIGVIILRATYGYYVTSPDDYILQLGRKGIECFSRTSAPGRYLVDMIPALQYLPSWMPGADFLKEAAEMRTLLHEVANAPYHWCKSNLDNGKTLMPNLCGTIIQNTEEEELKEVQHNVIWGAVSMLGGGLDTNVSTALSFVMAMILHPEIQKKAQAELDAVVGKERLPLISDRANMPYVRRIMAETLRWGPPAPLSLPHAVSEDDVYEGYYIPKGTLVLPNIWHMLHDPEVYPNPAQFNPDRFATDEDVSKTQELAFGFGRRICPGMHFAEGSLFAIIATMLATCDILPGLDAQGREVMPECVYTSGTVVLPEAFGVRLRARSKVVVGLLDEASAVPPE